jgi:arabinofuranosyltransferase
MPPAARRTAAERIAILAALALFALVLLRTAWVCDDAFITFRTVDNLLHGFGPRWNVAERVQAYTHPLWMLLLAAIEFVVRSGPYLTSIFASLVCSLIAAGLLAFGVARTGWQAVVGVLILTSAKSFVDFSSSGLENALSHALIILYVLALARPAAPNRVWLPTLVGSLLLVNRQDLIWLIGPSLVAYVVTNRSARSLRSLAIGLAPLGAWEVFSVVYYGFPVPNTAFAKLHTGIPERDLLIQGLRYLQESWLHDPLTLVVIAASVVAGWLGGRRALAAGVVLDLIYVAWVGGDFMSGRFLTAPLLVGVALMVTMPMPAVRPVARVAIAAAVIGLGLMASAPNLLTGPKFGHSREYVDFWGITDERKFYYPQTGLLRPFQEFVRPDLPEADFARWMISQGQRVATHEMVGMFGYGAAAELYVVDPYGLGDPLLARLPSAMPWRIGHFMRAVPDGYIQTLRSGQNQIVDPGVAEYYNALSLITRGPLLSAARWRAVVKMNLGLDDHLLDHYRAGMPTVR